MELWKLYDSMNALYLWYIFDETSGEYIVKKAGYYGIVRNLEQKLFNYATHRITGPIIPKGTVFLTADGLELKQQKQ